MMELIILTPAGEKARAECSSVTIFARDGADGVNGGSWGFRKGCLPAVAALEPGSRVKAFSDGNCVLDEEVKGGFASVVNDVVTVVTD